MVCVGCGDDEIDNTKFDGAYSVTFARDTGQEAVTCFNIVDGAYSISGLNSEGFPFAATGTINDAGGFVVNATLGSETTKVGIVAKLSDGAITGTYTIASGTEIVGAGAVSGSSVDSCPEPPEKPAQVNLADHYGVRVTSPVAGGGTLAVTTFNTGLAPTFVPFVAERLVPNLAAIPAHDADVICLQEVWIPAHVDALIEAAATTYPNSYSVPAEQVFTDGAPCTEQEVQPIKQCVTDNCGTLSGDAFTQCVIDSCSTVLFALNDVNPTCGGAVIALVGTDDIEAAFESVVKPTGLFAFGGSTGLILLSKTPFSETQVLDFIDKSTTNHRAALFATVNVGGVNHRVSCTHLTANLGNSVPYSGPFASWEDEGNQQAQDIIDFATTYAGADPTYLAGDFNCSVPNAATGVVGDFEANCQRLFDVGYASLGSEQLSCSFCDDNVLNTAKAGGGGEGNLLLDHVFTKNIAAGTITPEIVLDELVDL